MKEIKNVFGKGIMYNESDLKGLTYATSAACMSVWSDFLSWANNNQENITENKYEADNIVVLGCQVTDLSVLNDLDIAYKLHKETGKDIYMGGCLSQRFDINLPNYIKRLDVVRTLGKHLEDKSLVKYEKPYWVKDFKESDDNLREGNLFRNFYPLKIGAGCHGKCKYCTIRHTRGETYVTDPNVQIEEFLNHDNVVLTSDSPTVFQIKEWCRISSLYNKELSIRNIEPQVLIKCEDELNELADKGLLKILHCPIQSFNEEILVNMNRSVDATNEALEVMKALRKKGVLIATNIIIDYVIDGKTYHNFDKERLEREFDYYSWNPYFDGDFNIEKAKVRFKKYINN